MHAGRTKSWGICRSVERNINFNVNEWGWDKLHEEEEEVLNHGSTGFISLTVAYQCSNFLYHNVRPLSHCPLLRHELGCASHYFFEYSNWNIWIVIQNGRGAPSWRSLKSFCHLLARREHFLKGPHEKLRNVRNGRGLDDEPRGSFLGGMSWTPVDIPGFSISFLRMLKIRESQVRD